MITGVAPLYGSIAGQMTCRCRRKSPSSPDWGGRSGAVGLLRSNHSVILRKVRRRVNPCAMLGLSGGRFALGKDGRPVKRALSALIVIPTAPIGAVVLEAVKCGLASARQARCTPQGWATGNLASSLRAPALQYRESGRRNGTPGRTKKPIKKKAPL
jgi:hypothetical protein